MKFKDKLLGVLSGSKYNIGDKVNLINIHDEIKSEYFDAIKHEEFNKVYSLSEKRISINSRKSIPKFTFMLLNDESFSDLCFKLNFSVLIKCKNYTYVVYFCENIESGNDFLIISGGQSPMIQGVFSLEDNIYLDFHSNGCSTRGLHIIAMLRLLLINAYSKIDFNNIKKTNARSIIAGCNAHFGTSLISNYSSMQFILEDECLKSNLSSLTNLPDSFVDINNIPEFELSSLKFDDYSKLDAEEIFIHSLYSEYIYISPSVNYMFPDMTRLFGANESDGKYKKIYINFRLSGRANEISDSDIINLAKAVGGGGDVRFYFDSLTKLTSREFSMKEQAILDKEKKQHEKWIDLIGKEYAFSIAGFTLEEKCKVLSDGIFLSIVHFGSGQIIPFSLKPHQVFILSSFSHSLNNKIVNEYEIGRRDGGSEKHTVFNYAAKPQSIELEKLSECLMFDVNSNSSLLKTGLYNESYNIEFENFISFISLSFNRESSSLHGVFYEC